MLRQEEIAVVIDAQREAFMSRETGLEREALPNIPIAESFATIITGIRRGGKSTLLLQLLRKRYKDALYINFDDIRLSGFDQKDFVRLHKEVLKRGIKVLFFDEIQLIKEWEKYVNQLLREGYQVFITGSNASMLSVELGTHLTGRHLSTELFPFSFAEYIRFKDMQGTAEAVEEYLRSGGIPEYVKTGIKEILNALVEDILVRDIAVRHSVKDITSLKQLATYLITNIGNLVTAGKLTGMFDIKAASTFLEYFSYMKDSYLLDFVPMFSHSLKAQARNPRKVYVMDMGLYNENAVSMSENMGRRLENLIFLHLRRTHKNIFYYKGQGECDFVVMEKESIRQVVQVCLNLTDENFQREYDGLTEAMLALGVSEGTIVTLNQSDSFNENELNVNIIPANEFLMKSFN